MLAAAALLPPLLWLSPALLGRQAPSFRDQGDFFYPLKLYTADRLRSGEIPLWNPLSGAGEPWLANVQSGVFYPPALLFLLPSPALAGGLYLLLHFAIGAWGAWRFLKAEAVSDSGALLGAAVFSGCGFAASLSGFWNHFAAWGYLPGIVAFARSRLPTRGSRLALALLVGLQAMAGSPEISAATLLLALLLCLSDRADSQTGWAGDGRRVALLRFAAAALLGLALAAWALLPLAELALHSGRGAPLPATEREYGAIGAAALGSLVGTSESSGTPYLSTLHLGPLVLFAAAASLREPQRRKLALLLATVAGIGLLAAAAFPAGSWLRALPPLDRLRYPAKALCWTMFAVATMAGLGADGLRFIPPGRRGRILFGLLGVAALAAVAFSRLPADARAIEAAGVSALLLLLSGHLRARSWRAALEGLAALAAVASLARASLPAFRFVPEAEIRRRPEALSGLESIAGRVLTPPERELFPWVLGDAAFDAATLRRQREALLGYTNLMFQIPAVRTAAALPTRGAREIADSIDGADEPARAAGAAGARVLWSPFRPARLPSRKLGEFFRVPLAPYRPRLALVESFRVDPDARRAWSRAAKDELDWTHEVSLDRAPPHLAETRGERRFFLARLSSDRPERVAVEVTSRGGFLVLADLFYPGWEARVDGRPTQLFRADGLFRAVAVPPGSHQVLFRYRPLSFYAGAAVSLATLLLLAGFALQGEPATAGKIL